MSKTNDPMPMTTADLNDRLRINLGAAFGLFDRVRHVGQDEGRGGIVTGLTVRDGGRIVYAVAWGPGIPETDHYGPELEPADDEAWAD